MQTVVSFVPLPMERDTRTIKIAASLARLGYRSVVIESLPSDKRDHGPVELRTLAMRSPGPARRDARPTDRRPRICGNRATRWVRERLHFLAFVARYFVWLPLLALGRVPPGDLYYLHEYRLFPAVWLLRRIRRKVPMIYDAHDVYAEVWDQAQLSPFWKKRFVPFLLWMERACAREAAAVVTVGNGVATRIGELLGVVPKVLRNCQDRRLLQTPPQTLRQRLGLGRDAILVVVIGHRKPGQALEPLAAALAGAPAHVHVAFIGSFYDEVAALAETYGVTGRMHAPGPMASEQIVRHVEDCDAAALLYYGHSANTLHILPNGFFQAVTARLPLLYPPLPELEAAIGDRRVGWRIDARDRESIAAALAGLTALDGRGRSALADELARLDDELSWEREEEKLADLVKTVLKRCES